MSIKPLIVGVTNAFSPNTLITMGIPFLIAFFTPITSMLIGVGIFAMADTFTGMWAAKKRGDKIHSRAMGRTITKIIMYSIAIILAHVLQVIFMSWMPIANITAGYIALVEFRSNMENIGEITNIDIWNYLKDKIEIFKPKEDNKGVSK